MTIHLRVGNRIWEVGRGDLLHAFCSTVSYHLEPDGWGSRFPRLMQEFYQGRIATAHAREAQAELRTVQQELKRYPPLEVIRDIANRTAAPPWRDQISPIITDLSGYFVTSDGRDLIAVIETALCRPEQVGGELMIQ